MPPLAFLLRAHNHPTVRVSGCSCLKVYEEGEVAGLYPIELLRHPTASRRNGEGTLLLTV